MRQTSDERNGTEIAERFKDVLVSALDTVELVRLLVVPGRCVEIGILDVVLFAGFHDFARNDEIRYSR